MMKRFLCIAISAAVLLGVVAQQPAMTDIKKQKKEAQQDIKKTSQKIKLKLKKKLFFIDFKKIVKNMLI